eukprot:11493616-Heterocapsa_arctica.AAC.1
MEIGALKGKGKGKGKGKKGGGKGSERNDCGKPGHWAKDCWQEGGSAAGGKKWVIKDKDKGKKDSKGGSDKKTTCFKCGIVGHMSKECRASEAKVKAYKEKQGKSGHHEVQDEREGRVLRPSFGIHQGMALPNKDIDGASQRETSRPSSST